MKKPMSAKWVRVASIAASFMLVAEPVFANVILVQRIHETVKQIREQADKINCGELSDGPQPPPTSPTLSQCNNCKNKATSTANEITKTTNETLSQFQAKTGQCMVNTGKVQAGAQKTQLSMENATQNISKMNEDCQKELGVMLQPIVSRAGQCDKDLASACKGVNGGADMQASCQSVQKTAQQLQAEKGMSAGSMLDNALKAAQLASMLGQLAQQGQGGGNKGGSGVSGGAATPPIQKVNLDKNGTSSNVAGFGTSASKNGGGGTAGFQKGGAEGFTPFTPPKDFHYEPPGSGSSGSVGESNISAPSGGAAASAGSAAGSGAGTGSSHLAEKDAGKEEGDVGAFEVASNTGGGRTSFLGLKSKGSELEDLAAPGETLGSDLGAGLGPLDDGRGLASAEQGALDGGISADDGTSLFSVVSGKLKEMKKRGSI